MNPRLPIGALATGLSAAAVIAFGTVPAKAHHAPGHTGTTCCPAAKAGEAAERKNKPCPSADKSGAPTTPEPGTPAAGGQTVGELAETLKDKAPAISKFLEGLPADKKAMPVSDLLKGLPKGLDVDGLLKGPLGGLLKGGLPTDKVSDLLKNLPTGGGGLDVGSLLGGLGGGSKDGESKEDEGKEDEGEDGTPAASSDKKLTDYTVPELLEQLIILGKLLKPVAGALKPTLGQEDKNVGNILKLLALGFLGNLLNPVGTPIAKVVAPTDAKS